MAIRIDGSNLGEIEAHLTIVHHRFSAVESALKSQPVSQPRCDVDQDAVISLILLPEAGRVGQEVIRHTEERRCHVVQI